MSELYFTTTELNMRSQPIVNNKNRIALLPQGHQVEKLEEVTSNEVWWKINTTINDRVIEGYVHSKYLKSSESIDDADHVLGIHAVHLHSKTNIKRSSAFGWHFSLNEPKRPVRTKENNVDLRVNDLTTIVKWLDVETSARYIPKPKGDTYCNIYAYDYCYLADVYLPRVWWTNKALSELAKGNKVNPNYGATVTELNANALFGWLKDFSKDFGWIRTFDLNELQEKSNKGGVGIICAKTWNGTPGHITVVPPETSQKRAIRKNNIVSSPLQSQAGRTCKQYFTGNWWMSKNYKEFGFWIHD